MPETLHPLPPDQNQRLAALDTSRSVMVQAPAGSGKTSLLTQRFLALLGKVNDPAEIVAITFTRAAAAEMRSRILAEIEKAAAAPAPPASVDPLSTPVLAWRALQRSQELTWNLLDQPTQLRISTIDSFCRELALQQPLISGLGGTLEIAPQPEVLYQRAARQILAQMDQAPAALREALEALLLWRDNNWFEMESLLVSMLGVRDRWMQDFVLDRSMDLDELRARLEQPFARAVAPAVETLEALFDQAPALREEILRLARFACEQTGGAQHTSLAEAAEFPTAPFETLEELLHAQNFYLALADFLLTESGLRRTINVSHGFPKERKLEKEAMLGVLETLRSLEGFEAALLAMRHLPPAAYTEDDWRIVRAAFTLLRHTAAELRTLFAAEGTSDFSEIAQTALAVLSGDAEAPAESTLALVEGIHHLLVDEFQDTSRRQHELLARIVAAWPDAEDRTCFVVGDPMQSIYFFRDAEAELFARVRDLGLELPDAQPLEFHSVRLTSNFRTAPELVESLNKAFAHVFAQDDGSGIQFAAATAARAPQAGVEHFQPALHLHLEFVPQSTGFAAATAAARAAREAAAEQRQASKERQIEEIVALIALHEERMRQAEKSQTGKYRVAVLGRSRSALMPIAEALHKARIAFRAVDLEPLAERPEIADALALARALMSPEDRIAWLGLLRAPWSALSLADLHTLVGSDQAQTLVRAVPTLLRERQTLLSPMAQQAVARVLAAVDAAHKDRALRPHAAFGSWIKRAWTRIGGPLTADATATANLDLLWQALDTLPDAEQDLFSPALDAALEKLTAQPDPTVNPDYGVQLMTIHKSKGLEFEVVLLPELQAASNGVSRELLSWLERGVENPEASEHPTEFLIAPLQARGEERGSARAWVERTRTEREHQELRRLLYVAATRAREELHLFARPAFKRTDDGLELAAPRASLLKTAWPALKAEIRREFQLWADAQTETATDSAQPATIASITATADNSATIRPTPLLRLTVEAAQQASAALSTVAESASPTAIETTELYERHAGGVHAQALGTAVHSCFEELAHLCSTLPLHSAAEALPQMAPRLAAAIRTTGFDRERSLELAKEAIHLAQKACGTPTAAWILAPHPEAASEQRWTGYLDGAMRTVQTDRIFKAGDKPFAGGSDVWWIIDYKTAQADADQTEAGQAKTDKVASTLEALRPRFSPQLAAYARALRLLKGEAVKICAAIYYPRMDALDWWPVE